MADTDDVFWSEISALVAGMRTDEGEGGDERPREVAGSTVRIPAHTLLT